MNTKMILILICILTSSILIGTEVNLYTNRHYDTDQKLLDEFTRQTGIKVNIVKGKADELIMRLKNEGKDTKADVLITADAGRLYRAKESNLLQPITSKEINKNIPKKFRDSEGYWFALTKRARVIVYAKDRVKKDEIKSYHDLVLPKWRKRVLIRSSENIYNQSLLASFIESFGSEEALKWAQGMVKNFARNPKGNDRAQATAIAAGVGDVAIINTYYLGKMLNSSNPEEVKVAKQLGVIFPKETHINISGIGVTKYAKNKENAIKLIEFLSGKESQKMFAEANYEYPVNPEIEITGLLKSWGSFEEQSVDFNSLGKNNKKAVLLFDQAGWK